MQTRNLKALLKQSLKTEERWSNFLLRAMLGIVLFPHGAQKVFGWFGGSGLDGSMAYFTETLGLPWIIALLVILIEFLGSLFLIAGIYTRITALTIFTLFIGIIFHSHLQYGFFMNWYGNQAGEGFEYHLLVLAMAISLALSGGGKYSYDRYLTNNLETV